MSSESVRPIQASPRATIFTTTELPSTRKGLLAASARHQDSQAASPQYWRKALNWVAVVPNCGYASATLPCHNWLVSSSSDFGAEPVDRWLVLMTIRRLRYPNAAQPLVA